MAHVPSTSHHSSTNNSHPQPWFYHSPRPTAAINSTRPTSSLQKVVHTPLTAVHGKIACSSSFYKSHRACIPLRKLARRGGHSEDQTEQDSENDEDITPTFNVPRWSLYQNFDWSSLSLLTLKYVCKVLDLPSSATKKKVLISYLEGFEESQTPRICPIFVAAQPKHVILAISQIDIISQISDGETEAEDTNTMVALPLPTNTIDFLPLPDTTARGSARALKTSNNESAMSPTLPLLEFIDNAKVEFLEK